MLDWNGVRHALTFLESGDDAICLQASLNEDLPALKNGVVRLLEKDKICFIECSENIIVPGVGMIYFETCDSYQAGFTHNCPHFTIDRIPYKEPTANEQAIKRPHPAS